jgi:hypothetical protein
MAEKFKMARTRMFQNSVNFYLNHLKSWILKHQFINSLFFKTSKSGSNSFDSSTAISQPILTYKLILDLEFFLLLSYSLGPKEFNSKWSQYPRWPFNVYLFVYLSIVFWPFLDLQSSNFGFLLKNI